MKTIYTFHRDKTFYPIELINDEDACANAEMNPGTVKVVNELNGKCVWFSPHLLIWRVSCQCHRAP